MHLLIHIHVSFMFHLIIVWTVNQLSEAIGLWHSNLMIQQVYKEEETLYEVLTYMPTE